MQVYLIDPAGHVGVEIRIEERHAIREEAKEKVKLEIITELSALYRF